MSELRRRNIADSTPVPRRVQTSSDATQSSLPSASVALKRVLVFSSLAISAGAFFWFYTQVQPASVNCYAICSRSGARVYTVDDVDPAVQCLVIRNQFIVDTGSLGAPQRDSGMSGQTDAIPEDVSARWYTANPSGLKFQIRYIDDESIVVPGLSG